jgi:hypothetical protein
MWNGKDWKESNLSQPDQSPKSLIFMLNNPHNVPARRFALKDERKNRTIDCYSDSGPDLSDIYVSDNCNANTNNDTKYFEGNCTNDTGLDGMVFFTGSKYFHVKEIEVFEITNQTAFKSCFGESEKSGV